MDIKTMNQEALDSALATWKILCVIRKGNVVKCNDPLFVSRTEKKNIQPEEAKDVDRNTIGAN